MDAQSHDIDSTTTNNNNEWHKTASSFAEQAARFDPNELPTVNSTNPNYQPLSNNSSHYWDKTQSTAESVADKTKSELKKGQQQVEDIITKSKRILKQQCKFNDSSSVSNALANESVNCVDTLGWSSTNEIN
jgi:hypothetical protein